MTRQTLFLALLAAVLTIGCPGAQELLMMKDAKTIEKAPPRVSNSGVGFRLADADDRVEGIEARKVAEGVPLGGAEAARLFARLPALVQEADDAQDFSMRERSIPAPRPGTTVELAFPPQQGPPPVEAQPSGPLRVERFAPEGEVPLAPNVSLTFSEPMVPITSIGGLAAEEIPATLAPRVEGSWSWLGTKTLVFQPAKRLPMATDFTVTVPAETKALSGQTLGEEVQWTFQTPPPTIVASFPHGDSVRLDPVIIIAFDQGIDPAAMLGSVELKAGGKEVALRLATQEEIEGDEGARRVMQRAVEGRWLAFTPATKLPNDIAMKVRITKGAKGAEGPRKTTEEQGFEFETFGPLVLTEARCGWHSNCPPFTPFRLEFSNALDLSSFDPAWVTVSPEIPGLKVDAGGAAITLSGRTKGRTSYTVTVDAALADVHGQTLGKAASATLKVGSAQPRLASPEREMVVLDPAGRSDFVVWSINEKTLHTQLYKVRPEDWKAFAAWRGDWRRSGEGTPPGRKVFDEVLHPREAPDELVATPIDLSAALEDGLGHAVLRVRAARRSGEREPEVLVWIQATKLGLQATLDRETAAAFVTRLEDGAPLDGVEVSLWGGGRTAQTRDGLATLPLSERGYPLVARLGADTTFLTEGWYGTESFLQRQETLAPRWFVFDDRGMYKPGEEVHLKGWVRADDLTLGGDLSLAGPDVIGDGVQYKVRDPRGAELASGRAVVDDQGGFHLSFRLPGNANLGQGWVELDLLGSKLRYTRTNHHFSIQEFRKPEYEVQTKVSEGPHFAGGQAVATVNASYYAGGGLADAPVEWLVRQTTTSFTPPNQGDFHFGPAPRLFWRWGWPTEEGEAKEERWQALTDAGGNHRLQLSFDALEPAYPFSLSLSSSVEDLNRQRWAGSASLLVHPSDRYVGLRLVKNFVNAGAPLVVELVVADLDGARMAGRTVEVRAARLESKRRGMEFSEEEVDAERCVVESTADGAPIRCSFPTTEGGRYRLTAVVQDEQGRRNQSTLEAWVLGGERPSLQRLEADQLTVVPDKNEYNPGETAAVLVIAPFAPAEGVLTVRRQGVVHLERFRMEETSRTFEVKLDDAMVPNVSIGVDLVGQALRTGADGEVDPSLPRRPAYASGVAEVKVLPSTRTLAVVATPVAPILSPGAETKVEVEVRDPSGAPAKNAEVAVIVVDEAVLALSGYQTPDPIAIFYQDRAADVRTLETRWNVILSGDAVVQEAVQEEAMGLGGMGTGGGRAMMMREMEASAPMAMKQADAADGAAAVADTSPIDLRVDFSSLALFAPRVRTDASGKASVAVKLPDNLTRYRVMAVASAGQNFFGSTESTITARLPLMVRPSAPRFLNFGDAFELSVLIQNQTGAAVEAAVVARAANATIEEAARRVTVPANDRVEVRFPASTLKTGTARFQFGVAAPGFADASGIELPVYTPATTEAFATYGEIDEGAIAQPVRMPEGVFPQFGGLEVSTSSTQLQALTDAMLYLATYPFDCSEQIASRVLAVAALRDVLGAFQAEGLPPPEELRTKMQDDLERLSRIQLPNGGWGFWQGQREAWPYISVHTTHALVRAKEKGYTPAQETLERAMRYLRNIETSIPAWYGEDARRSIVAYSIYVRARAGDADPVKARGLIQEAGGVDKLPIEALGWIWPTIAGAAGGQSGDSTLAAIRRHVANRVTETAGAAHFVTGYGDSEWVVLHSSRRADGVLLEAMIGDQPDSTLIPKLVKGLLAHRKAGRWTNTQENAFVLLALDRYFHTYEKVTPNFVARIWLGDGFAGEHAFRGRTTEQSELKIPMSWLAKNTEGTQDLVLGKDGPGRLYYRLGMQYAPTDLKLPPLDRGFEVSRTYEGADSPEDVRRDEDGSWRVRLGARVRVRVSMVAQARRYHVALVDPLPAGFEPLNPALAVTGEIPKDPKVEADAGQGGGWWRWLWSRTWYEHQNLRDDRAEAFASLLYGGVWDYSYVATATTPGSFVVPPPKAEEMYAPETFGRGAGDRVIVE